LKTPFPPPPAPLPYSSGLTSLLNSLPPPLRITGGRGMGAGGCSQFITRCLCCSFLLRGRTPHTLPLLQCEGPSHRRQFCTNFSIMGPSHGLQLFTNCPSVGPFPQGAVLQEQAAPAAPRGHKPCQQICSTVDLHGLQGNSLPHHGLLQGNLYSGAYKSVRALFSDFLFPFFFF